MTIQLWTTDLIVLSEMTIFGLVDHLLPAFAVTIDVFIPIPLRGQVVHLLMSLCFTGVHAILRITALLLTRPAFVFVFCRAQVIAVLCFHVVLFLAALAQLDILHLIVERRIRIFEMGHWGTATFIVLKGA